MISGRWEAVLRRVLRTAAVVCLAGAASGQQAPLTIEEAVREAAAHYPAVQAAAERSASAAAGVSLARTAGLPRMDLLTQVNRATRNNVFGMLLPQSTVAPISGPVLGTSGADSVWGSAAGLLVSWEPFDFGLRLASENAARAEHGRSHAAEESARFEVSALAADSFLTVLGTEQAEKAAAAGVARLRTFLEVIEALAGAQLRPEADVSRSRAELAMAEARQIQAAQAVREARIRLAQYTGREAETLAASAGPLLDPFAEPVSPEGVEGTHPMLEEQAAAAAAAEARRKVYDHAWYPRFLLQGAGYARGSGARTDGSRMGGASGLAPDVPNWAVGMTVAFPILELPSIRARQRVEAHLERAEQEKQRQVSRELEARLQSALAALDGARDVAVKVPVQLAAARTTLEQAVARYRAGLAGIVDVADAQRLVTQAETDDSLARLSVWRAYLAVASARGDLGPFLRAAAK